MRQIRHNVFETNSSSTHSLTICPTDTYKKFVDGKLYLHGKEFYTKEDMIECIKNNKYYEGEFDKININNPDSYENFCDIIEEYEFYDYNHYGQDYEYYESNYITESGDDITAFGYYGQNY